MFDQRTRYFRKLRRRRSAARRWAVLGGGLAGVTAVLAPYQGLGPADAAWAGLAGAAVALAWWRWAEARALAAGPVPDPPDPTQATDHWLRVLGQVPGGAVLADQVRRQRTRGALRGSGAGPLWERLERATGSLRSLRSRFTHAPADTLDEAGAVEHGLRELTARIADLERAVRLAPADAQPSLHALRASHLAQLETGVSAYERFVVAATEWLAESERPGGTDPALTRLAEATDTLRGVTAGLTELRPLREPG